MIELTLAGIQWSVAEVATPAGPMKLIRLVDPQSGIVVNVPFDADATRKLSAALNGIEVATILPPNGHRP